VKNQCKQEFEGSDQSPDDDCELSFVNSRPIVPLDTAIGDFPPVQRPLHADRLMHVFEVSEQGNRASVIVLTEQGEKTGASLMAAQQKWYAQHATNASSQIKQAEVELDGKTFASSYIQLLGRVAVNTPGKLREMTDESLKAGLERAAEYERAAHELGLLASFLPSTVVTHPLFGEYRMTPFALHDLSLTEKYGDLLKDIGGARTYVKLLYWLMAGINLFSEETSGKDPSLLSCWAPLISLRSAELLRQFLGEKDDHEKLEFAAILQEFKKGDSPRSSVQAKAPAAAADGGLKRVVGMRQIKQTIERELLLPVKDEKLFKEFGLSPVTSALFFGPSGCGKTHLAKHIAEELGVLMLQIRPSDIASMYVRESVLRLRSYFDEAIRNKPCLMFFDEFDCLVPDRNQLGPGQDYKIEEVNEILIGLEQAKEQGVFVIAASNQPFYMDHSIFRAGRFDKVIYVAPPDPDERVELLTYFLQPRLTMKDLDLESINERLDGYSVADLRALVDEAASISFSLGRAPISAAILGQAMSKVQASISSETERRFAKFIETGFGR